MTAAALAWALLALLHPDTSAAQSRASFSLLPATLDPCAVWNGSELQRNPTEAELRCRHGIRGPGRFGLSYADVPVYQPATPLPGTHVVGVPGMPRPAIGESYEAWEWRVLRTQYPRDVLTVHRGLELLDPLFAERLLLFERRLAEAGIYARRRETWRSWERQAYLFQLGRSRPGPFVTTTLTSWHCRVDERGQPASRAADYNVSGRQLQRFHAIAWELGLESFGPDSHDPGHVYLPVPEDLDERERILLRLLPSVPVVTLATGRPVDEQLPSGALAERRAASYDFASGPFVPHPELRLAGDGILWLPWADSAAARAAPPVIRAPKPRRGGLLGGLFCRHDCRR